MSQFLPEDFQQQNAPKDTTTVPVKGPEQYLSPEERTFLQRMLSFPADIPPQFRSWMLDYIAVNGLEIPISQVRGYKNAVQEIVDTSLAQFQDSIKTASVSGSKATASTSYIDLFPGPTISSLLDGQYLFLYGARMGVDTANHAAAMSIKINSTPASDNDFSWSATIGYDVSTARAVFKTLSNSNNNTVQNQYRAVYGGTATFADPWLIAFRIGI